MILWCSLSPILIGPKVAAKSDDRCCRSRRLLLWSPRMCCMEDQLLQFCHHCRMPDARCCKGWLVVATKFAPYFFGFASLEEFSCYNRYAFFLSTKFWLQYLQQGLTWFFSLADYFYFVVVDPFSFCFNRENAVFLRQCSICWIGGGMDTCRLEEAEDQGRGIIHRGTKFPFISTLNSIGCSVCINGEPSDEMKHKDH
jgi:hypothetical protein